MSNFGAKLAELLERRQMRASELSRVSGINDGLISKWINGQQKYVANDDLANLAGSISANPREQAELIRAHLQDELVGPGSELIDIRIRGQTSYLREDAPAYHTDLPLKLQRAFETLAREAVADAEVRSVVLGVANILDDKPTRVTRKKKVTRRSPAEPEHKGDIGQDVSDHLRKLAED